MAFASGPAMATGAGVDLELVLEDATNARARLLQQQALPWRVTAAYQPTFSFASSGLAFFFDVEAFRLRICRGFLDDKSSPRIGACTLGPGFEGGGVEGALGAGFLCPVAEGF